MARLWSSGFELQSATSGIEWETTVGSPSINTTTKRTGAASLRCNPSSASAYLQHTLMTGTTTSAHVYLRAYVYIATLPSANSMIMGWIDSSPFGYGVRLRTDGKLQIGGTNSVLIGTASTNALSTGQWYRIELDYDDGTDVATCYVDGVSYCTLSGADTFGGALAMFGLFDSCTADVYFDDLAVNDNSGSTQNGLPGAGSIVHLKPNAQGDNNGFATAVGGTAGAANNYTRVSETTPDDLTSYNNTTVTGTTTIDDFNVTDSTTAGIGSSDTITLVQVGQRAGSGATTTASIVTRIKAAASGTVQESASLPVNVNGFRTHATAAPYTYKLTAYVKPSSTAWTPSDLDSMQIGYRGNVSQTSSRRVTTIWALVEFVPSSNDHFVSVTAGMTLDATATKTTDRPLAVSGGMTLDATATKTTERSVSVTGGMTLSASETHSNSTNDHTVAVTANMALDARATVTSNHTVAVRAEMQLSARATSYAPSSGSAYVWAHDIHAAPTDLEITVRAARDDDWRPPQDQTLVSKWVTAGNAGSWFLYIDADGEGDPSLVGRPVMAWSPTGDIADLIQIAATSRPPIDPTGAVTLRVFLDVDNDAGGYSVTFETQDQNGAWIQLGDVVSRPGPTSIHSSEEDYEIGATDDGSQSIFKGRIYYVQIRDGRTGAILGDPDFTSLPGGTTSFSDDSGLTWVVATPAKIVSSQRVSQVAIEGPVSTGECIQHTEYKAPRIGQGDSCEYHPGECCSTYEVRTVAFVDGSVVVSDWVPGDDDACLIWDDNEHILRSEAPNETLWVSIGGIFTWDRDRPFTATMGVAGTQFVTSAPPGGRNLHLTTAVETEAQFQQLMYLLARPHVLISPSDSDETWAAPVAGSARVVKVGRIRQVTADFIATGPPPPDQFEDL